MLIYNLGEYYQFNKYKFTIRDTDTMDYFTESDYFGMFAFVVLCLFVLAFYIIYKSQPKQKTPEEMYEEILKELKKDPTNPELREQALQLGRDYYNTTDASADELAIMNDINAACARAAIAAQPELAPANQIEALSDLMQAGVLSPDEFRRAKANIIGKPPSQVDEATKLLAQLYQLYKQGVLTQSEYNIKKWDILSQRLIPKDDISLR